MRAEQKQECHHGDDKMKLRMRQTSASGDTQQGGQRNAAFFVSQGASQHTSREQKMKVDPTNQVRKLQVIEPNTSAQQKIHKQVYCILL